MQTLAENHRNALNPAQDSLPGAIFASKIEGLRAAGTTCPAFFIKKLRKN